MSRRGLPRPLQAAGGAVLVAVAALLLAAGTGPVDGPLTGDTAGGAVLSEEDRRELAALPVERGAQPDPIDPAVDLTDPQAVARAFLVAAHSVSSGDTGRTHLRATGYAVPGSPPATVGVVVLDPPAAGSVRTAAVTALELVAADHDDRRRGYLAEIGTATGPPGGPFSVDVIGRHVVLARQPDGRWLVAAESAESVDLPAGED